MSRSDVTVSSVGAPPPLAPASLLVVGEGHTSIHDLPHGTVLTMGRQEGCEITIDHPKISRRHASFHGGPTVEVEDLGSTNGIRVGGKRLATGARLSLRPGDTVQIGPFIAVLMPAPRDSHDTPTLAAIPVTDPTAKGVSEIVRRVAQGAVSVHITGETGSGKEVLARTLHDLSGRKGRFVAINCATLGENLLESELFGHEKGSFTGAPAAKPGLLELAAGGTVLLDEIGDLPAALQGKLLRVIETREVFRVGGIKPVTIDARFLSATYRDLVAEVARGRFRRDLYFRINGLTLAVAPLRERRDAIPSLASQLLKQAAVEAGRPAPRIGSVAIAALERHAWPGNVRELRTVMEGALLLATGDELRAVELIFDRIPAAENDDPLDPRARLTAAAGRHHGNVTSIAQAMGTSRSQVRRLAQRFGIDLEKYRE